MKKLFIYYLFVLLPIFGIIMIHNSLVFCVVLSIYVLVYRPIIDYLRLKSLNIDENFYSYFIPFYIHTKYFKKLYASIGD